MRNLNSNELQAAAGGNYLIVTQKVDVKDISTACVDALLYTQDVNLEDWKKGIMEKCTMPDLMTFDQMIEETQPFSIARA